LEYFLRVTPSFEGIFFLRFADSLQSRLARSCRSVARAHALKIGDMSPLKRAKIIESKKPALSSMNDLGSLAIAAT
jgi:hypothetical protein